MMLLCTPRKNTKTSMVGAGERHLLNVCFGALCLNVCFLLGVQHCGGDRESCHEHEHKQHDGHLMSCKPNDYIRWMLISKRSVVCDLPLSAGPIKKCRSAHGTCCWRSGAAHGDGWPSVSAATSCSSCCSHLRPSPKRQHSGDVCLPGQILMTLRTPWLNEAVVSMCSAKHLYSTAQGQFTAASAAAASTTQQGHARGASWQFLTGWIDCSAYLCCEEAPAVQLSASKPSHKCQRRSRRHASRSAVSAGAMAWLAIGIPTVPRKGGADYLTPTIGDPCNVPTQVLSLACTYQAQHGIITL